MFPLVYPSQSFPSAMGSPMFFFRTSIAHFCPLTLTKPLFSPHCLPFPPHSIRLFPSLNHFSRLYIYPSPLACHSPHHNCSISRIFPLTHPYLLIISLSPLRHPLSSPHHSHFLPSFTVPLIHLHSSELPLTYTSPSLIHPPLLYPLIYPFPLTHLTSISLSSDNHSASHQPMST